MAGEIVLGYDGSDCAKAALREATRLAKATGERVVVVFGYGVWPGGGEDRDYVAALEEMGRAATADALDELRSHEVEAEVALVRAKPADAILQTAEQRAASLIVVGTYGEGPIAAALVGSVPHKLMQRSRIPVLVVPASDS